MHIVVCIKQVPDSAQIRVHPVTNTIMRQGVPTILNPYDLFALEAALRLRDQIGAEVSVLTMGPPMAEDTLRKALGFGADRAVLLTDRAFAGSDTLATSFALSQAIKRMGEEWGEPDDRVYRQADDRWRYRAGRPRIARRLGSEPGDLCVGDHRDRSGRGHDFVAAPGRRRRAGNHHAAAGVDHHAGGSNEVRRGSLPEALRAARAQVVVWNAAQAGITEMTKCGLRGSPTVVKRVFAPPARAVKRGESRDIRCQ